MFNRGRAMIAAASFVMAAFGVPLAAQEPSLDGLGHGLRLREKRGKGQRNKRGKGLRSKPKARPNRLTISKRVRRKHRRAA